MFADDGDAGRGTRRVEKSGACSARLSPFTPPTHVTRLTRTPSLPSPDQAKRLSSKTMILRASAKLLMGAVGTYLIVWGNMPRILDSLNNRCARASCVHACLLVESDGKEGSRREERESGVSSRPRASSSRSLSLLGSRAGRRVASAFRLEAGEPRHLEPAPCSFAARKPNGGVAVAARRVRAL